MGLHFLFFLSFSDNVDGGSEFKCPLCDKILGSRNAIQRHRREVHSDYSGSESGTSSVGGVTSSAPSTGAAAATPAATVVGGARSGGNAPPTVPGGGAGGGPPDASARVACEKCGRTFKNKSNLKIHMLTHSGVKPFG